MRKQLFKVECEKISPIPTLDMTARDRKQQSMQDSLLLQAKEELKMK